MATLFHLLYAGQEAAFESWASERLKAWAAGFDRWLNQCVEESQRARWLQQHTWKNLLGYVRKVPWEIGSADISAWCAYLIEEERKSSATVRSMVGRIKKFYDWAAAEQLDPLVATNPVHGANVPVDPRKLRVDSLDREETEALLASIDRETSVIDKRDYALMLVLLLTGLYLVEARGLQWKSWHIE